MHMYSKLFHLFHNFNENGLSSEIKACFVEQLKNFNARNDLFQEIIYGFVRKTCGLNTVVAMTSSHYAQESMVTFA